MSKFAFRCQNEKTSITSSGTKNSNPRSRATGSIGDSSRRRVRRLREATTVGGIGSIPSTTSAVIGGGSRAEDRVEELDGLVGGCARALEDHMGEHVTRLAVEIAVGLVLLALVHQEGVGLLIEQRPAI